jgi:hypothetical protein
MTRIGSAAVEDRVTRSRLVLLSGLLGAAVADLAFVLLLQTETLSSMRLLAALLLFAAVSVLHYWIGLKWLVPKMQEPGSGRLVGGALFVVAVLFPLLVRPPSYPVSPLLRPWSDLAIQFEVSAGGEPLVLRPEAVRLVMGKEALNTTGFQLVGPWQSSPEGLALPAGSTASLRWTGTIPETTSLIIQPPGTAARLTVYWDESRTTSDLHAGEHAAISLTRKEPVPWGFSVAYLLGLAIVVAWVASLLTLYLAKRMRGLAWPATSGSRVWMLVLLAFALAAVTVKLQVDSLEGGLQYLTTTQLIRHNAVLQGTAPDPWQYRVFSEFVAEGMLRILAFLGPQAAVVAGFLSLRVLQNIAILLAAFALYRKASDSDWLGLLGMLILAGSMLNAYYDNDLSFNTYFDLLFYLLCVLLLLSRRYSAVVILTVFAALNRETSALIPFVMAGALYGDNTRPGLRRYMPVLLSLAIFIVVFVGLRTLYAPRPLYVPYHQAPGIPLLLYNLTRWFTWQQLLSTMGLVPIVGLLFFSALPPLWQRLFLIVGPIWFLIHSFASVMAETRLFLVPQAILFIPAALIAMRAWLQIQEHTVNPSPLSSLGAS